MDAILTDSHLDTRIEICILTNVIAPKLKNAKVWEGNAKVSKQLKTVQMTAAAERIKICSSTTSNAALRVELQMYPLKTET